MEMLRAVQQQTPQFRATYRAEERRPACCAPAHSRRTSSSATATAAAGTTTTATTTTHIVRVCTGRAPLARTARKELARTATSSGVAACTDGRSASGVTETARALDGAVAQPACVRDLAWQQLPASLRDGLLLLLHHA
jgi:hypothetical protein